MSDWVEAGEKRQGAGRSPRRSAWAGHGRERRVRRGARGGHPVSGRGATIDVFDDGPGITMSGCLPVVPLARARMICDVRFTSRQCGRNIQHSTFNTQRPRSEGARRVWPWGNASCLVGWRLAKSARGLVAVQDAPRGRGTGWRGAYGGGARGGHPVILGVHGMSFFNVDRGLVIFGSGFEGVRDFLAFASG